MKNFSINLFPVFCFLCVPSCPPRRVKSPGEPSGRPRRCGPSSWLTSPTTGPSTRSSHCCRPTWMTYWDLAYSRWGQHHSQDWGFNNFRLVSRHNLSRLESRELNIPDWLCLFWSITERHAVSASLPGLCCDGCAEWPVCRLPEGNLPLPHRRRQEVLFCCW